VTSRRRDAAAEACALRLRIIMLWYPIKDARTTQTWQKTLAAMFDCENLVSNGGCIRAIRVCLEWSGVLILNPPIILRGMQLWLATARRFSAPEPRNEHWQAAERGLTRRRTNVQS